MKLTDREKAIIREAIRLSRIDNLDHFVPDYNLFGISDLDATEMRAIRDEVQSPENRK